MATFEGIASDQYAFATGWQQRHVTDPLMMKRAATRPPEMSKNDPVDKLDIQAFDDLINPYAHPDGTLLDARGVAEQHMLLNAAVRVGEGSVDYNLA